MKEIMTTPLITKKPKKSKKFKKALMRSPLSIRFYSQVYNYLDTGGEVSQPRQRCAGRSGQCCYSVKYQLIFRLYYNLVIENLFFSTVSGSTA